jgi:hypothetical protein
MRSLVSVVSAHASRLFEDRAPDGEAAPDARHAVLELHFTWLPGDRLAVWVRDKLRGVSDCAILEKSRPDQVGDDDADGSGQSMGIPTRASMVSTR